MTPTPLDDLVTKLGTLAGILSLPEPERTTDIQQFLPELSRAAKAAQTFCLGFADEHNALIEQVFKLLGTVFVYTRHVGFHMATELPPGTAPQFRRALNEIADHIAKRMTE